MIASTQTNHPLAGAAASPDALKARLDSACDRLHAAGMRVTQPRIVILKVLMSFSLPVSIEQIHASLSGHPHECDLVTVYRCLGAFGDIGLVRRTFAHNGTSLYQMADQGEVAYHVFCKSTNEVHTLDTETSQTLAAALRKVEESLRARGFTDVGHQLEFYAHTAGATPAPTRRSQKANIAKTAEA
jgi:Fur family transcriptional regulator, ferric uptake regulator